MRKLLVLGAAVVGLLGVTGIASADPVEAPEINHAFFFGDCEPYRNGSFQTDSASLLGGSGCKGFGFFFGEYTAQTLADAIEKEYHDQYDAYGVVTKLYARLLGLGTNFAEPIVGGMNGEYGSCYVSTDSEGSTQLEGINFGGLWIAWFAIQPCDYYENDN